MDSFHVSTCNPVCTPVDKTLILQEPSENLYDGIPYRRAVESFMNLDVTTRLDIAYAISVQTEVLGKPLKIHWSLLKRILKYFKGTFFKIEHKN